MQSTDLQTLKKKFENDLFVTEGIGAVIEDASYGFAKCRMKIEPRHCNALGIPMGGAIFTLADFAFAVAANQNGRDVVSQTSQISFLNPSRGTMLVAEAKLIRDGKHTCFYRIEITDDLEKSVAFITINGYVVNS
ncbi:MAG: PaaI family thioesterase [Evtepia sp.]